MAPTSVGRLLLNDALPASHQIDSEIAKKQVNRMMVDLAHKDPKLYVKTISRLKRLGDEVATDEGWTVGLDDIEPDYTRRDAVLEPALKQIRKIRDPDKRAKLIEKTQTQLMRTTERHPGQLTPMAISGARGKVAQLMRTVASPTAIVDDAGQTIPWLISKSYAEGLKAPDAWVAMGEARRNAVETYTQVAAPGEMSKILVNNMSDQLITMPDCGTHNGVMVEDVDAVDRYLAKSGELLRASNVRGKRVMARSPMTCEAPDGVCQKCYGLNTRGQVPTLGTNVGMMAAHAMGEPLTQLALNAKHAVRTADSERAVLQGLSGFKQITEIPQTFFNKATLASRPGLVKYVEGAPQGGYYVHVENDKHYVPPALNVQVKQGDRVDAGDVLSDGIPKPDEIVKYKGLGAGRRYIVDRLDDIYRQSGIGLDRRHLEILAKTDLNYVKINDQDSSALGAKRGDVMDYNRFRAAIAREAETVPTSQAVGSVLGGNVLHYTVGTPVTAALAKEFTRSGIRHVPIAPRVPAHEPIMKPISRTPLLHPDWLAKLGHRNLKNTILEGAAFGDTSQLRGTHPVPAFVFGEQFGAGTRGRY